MNPSLNPLASFPDRYATESFPDGDGVLGRPPYRQLLQAQPDGGRHLRGAPAHGNNRRCGRPRGEANGDSYRRSEGAHHRGERQPHDGNPSRHPNGAPDLRESPGWLGSFPGRGAHILFGRHGSSVVTTRRRTKRPQSPAVPLSPVVNAQAAEPSRRPGAARGRLRGWRRLLGLFGQERRGKDHHRPRVRARGRQAGVGGFAGPVPNRRFTRDIHRRSASRASGPQRRRLFSWKRGLQRKSASRGSARPVRARTALSMPCGSWKSRRAGNGVGLKPLSIGDGVLALLGNGFLATSSPQHWRAFLRRSRLIAERTNLFEATMPYGLDQLAEAARRYIVNSAS